MPFMAQKQLCITGSFPMKIGLNPFNTDCVCSLVSLRDQRGLWEI